MKADLIFFASACLPIYFLCACAAGPKDALDGTGHDVRADASAPTNGAYAYVARRALVAVALAEMTGLADADAHHVVDHLADEAEACFERSKELGAGAGRITLPVDEGGVTGAPEITFSPPNAAPQGMVCVLAPFRLSTFAPATSPRSITIEVAWGNDLRP